MNNIIKMNILLDMLILFVFLTIMFIPRIPDPMSNNLIFQQLFVYVIITAYYVGQKIIEKKVIKKELINIKQIILESLKNAVPCLFGFILFTDLRLMDSTKNFVSGIISTNPTVSSQNETMTGGDGDYSRIKLAPLISFIIVLFTLITRSITLLIDVETYI